MDYLARNDAPISAELWQKIDETVIENAKQHMVCRRFLSIYGPLGAGAAYVNVDSAAKEETAENNVARVTGRRIVELPQLYQDFNLLWRDIAEAEKMGYPLDLSAAAAAAQKAAKQEDNLILFGSKELGVEGLFNAKGAFGIKRGDWTTLWPILPAMVCWAVTPLSSALTCIWISSVSSPTWVCWKLTASRSWSATGSTPWEPLVWGRPLWSARSRSIWIWPWAWISLWVTWGSLT